MIERLLKQFLLSAEVYHNAKVCGDWLIREHELGQTCFHMPTEGGCYIAFSEQERYRLNEGDLVIFPRELPHSMCPLEPQKGEQSHLPYAQASKRTGTGMLCGKISFEHAGSEAMLESLPAFIIVRKGERTPWLLQLRDLLIRESYRDNHSPLINRLSELVFIYALRYFVEHEWQGAGHFALYSDVKLEKAIRSIHQQPSYHWTLDELAEISGMSRTAFAASFKKRSSWTPMQYLNWWRMQLAYNYLVQGKSVLDVALSVGYRSEAAFSRSFQKAFGVNAGKVRRAHQ